MDPLYRSGAPLPDVTSVRRSHHCACQMQHSMSCILTGSVRQVQAILVVTYSDQFDTWICYSHVVTYTKIIAQIWIQIYMCGLILVFKHSFDHGLPSLYSD